MANSTTEQRRCPTREDDAEVLIAHTIDAPTCQKRQRGLYHKCFACVHRNAAPVPAARRPAAIMELPAPPSAKPAVAVG